MSSNHDYFLNCIFPEDGDQVLHTSVLAAKYIREGNIRFEPKDLSSSVKLLNFYFKNNWVSRNIDLNNQNLPKEPQELIKMRRIIKNLDNQDLIHKNFFSISEYHLTGDFDRHTHLDYFEYALWRSLGKRNLSLDKDNIIRNRYPRGDQGAAPDVMTIPQQAIAEAPPAEPEVELDVFNGDANARQQVEQAAMQACTEYYSAQEETIEVLDVAARRCGWDIEVTRQDESTLYVEVKGRSGDGQQLIFTANEIRQSNIHHESYEVFLVRLENGEVTRSHRQGPICAVLPHAPVIAVILDIEGMGGWVEL